MKYTREEQETVITFETETGLWSFYTSVTNHINSFMKNPLIIKEIQVLTEYEGVPTSIQFTVENALVSKSFFKKQRKLSEAHREALAQGRAKALTKESPIQ